MTAPTILLERGDGPRRSPLAAIIAIIVLTLAGTIAIQQHRLSLVRQHAAAAALTATNLAAQRDTTRELTVGARDSLRRFERRVTQEAQRPDALDAALHDERIARYSLQAVVDSLRRSLKAASEDDSLHRFRFADFTLRHEPYTIDAHVEVPAPPDSATMSLRIQLDSLPIDARIECAAPDAGGIRAASLVATVPRWAGVRLRRLEQSPEVCAPPALHGVMRRRLQFSPLMIGFGRSFGLASRPEWSFFIGTGFTL